MTDTLTMPVRMPIEHRSAQTIDVRFPDRIIQLIAIPYDEDTRVLHEGRWITESVAPGSFDGVERRANRVKVNREHDSLLTVGRTVALHPSRSEGLIADVKISRTPLGEETLELASDGALDASVGFAPFPGFEHYTERRTRRRITKAFLDHIALTADPAYEGANVLAVRNITGVLEDTGHVERVPTPFLDQILAERLEREYRSRL